MSEGGPGHFEDWYGVLGVAPDATQVEVRRAYLALAKQLHPDHKQDAAASRREDEARFAQVSSAWASLSDPAKREAYDKARQSHLSRRMRASVVIQADDMQIDGDGDVMRLSAPCRCGGAFTVTLDQLEESGGELLVPCDACSFQAQVVSDTL